MQYHIILGSIIMIPDCILLLHWQKKKNSPQFSYLSQFNFWNAIPDSKVHGDNMGPIWGRQDPGGPHVGPMNLAIWDILWGLVSQFPSLAHGRCHNNIKSIIYEHMLQIKFMNISRNCSHNDPLEHLWWQVNIGSGNSLVLSGNKPQHEPMLIWIYVVIWHH